MLARRSLMRVNSLRTLQHLSRRAFSTPSPSAHATKRAPSKTPHSTSEETTKRVWIFGSFLVFGPLFWMMTRTDVNGEARGGKKKVKVVVPKAENVEVDVKEVEVAVESEDVEAKEDIVEAQKEIAEEETTPITESTVIKTSTDDIAPAEEQSLVEETTPSSLTHDLVITQSTPSPALFPKYLQEYTLHKLTPHSSSTTSLTFKSLSVTATEAITVSLIGHLDPSLKTVSVWANPPSKRDPLDASEEYTRGLVFYLSLDRIGNYTTNTIYGSWYLVMGP